MIKTLNNIIETILGFIVIIIAVGFLFYVYKENHGKGALSEYRLVAKFDRIDGLNIGSDVKLSGIKIGYIKDVEIDPVSYRAKVIIHVNADIKLPLDSSADISSDGLLGGKYIAIIPGTEEGVLTDFGIITKTHSAVSFEGLLSKFLVKDDGAKDTTSAPKTEIAKATPAISSTPVTKSTPQDKKSSNDASKKDDAKKDDAKKMDSTNKNDVSKKDPINSSDLNAKKSNEKPKKDSNETQKTNDNKGAVLTANNKNIKADANIKSQVTNAIKLPDDKKAAPNNNSKGSKDSSDTVDKSKSKQDAKDSVKDQTTKSTNNSSNQDQNLDSSGFDDTSSNNKDDNSFDINVNSPDDFTVVEEDNSGSNTFGNSDDMVAQNGTDGFGDNSIAQDNDKKKNL